MKLCFLISQANENRMMGGRCERKLYEQVLQLVGSQIRPVKTSLREVKNSTFSWKRQNNFEFWALTEHMALTWSMQTPHSRWICLMKSHSASHVPCRHFANGDFCPGMCISMWCCLWQKTTTYAHFSLIVRAVASVVKQRTLFPAHLLFYSQLYF